jgi:hypothetical protein
VSTTTDTQIRVPVSGIYVVSMTVAARHMFSPQNPELSVSLEFLTTGPPIVKSDFRRLLYMSLDAPKHY